MKFQFGMRGITNMKTYGIICEFKDEAPIILECKPMTSEEAYQAKQRFLVDQRIIRVAIFIMTYVSGNQTLIPTEAAGE